MQGDVSGEVDDEDGDEDDRDEDDFEDTYADEEEERKAAESAMALQEQRRPSLKSALKTSHQSPHASHASDPLLLQSHASSAAEAHATMGASWGASEAEDEGPGAQVQGAVDAMQTYFKPEPLHVRTLCRTERRKAMHLQAREQQRLEQLEAALTDKHESSAVDIITEVKRVHYKLKLLKLRLERFSKLNPRTHEELPQQMIEAAHDGDAGYITLGFEARVDLDVLAKDNGITPLIAATITNKVNVVKLLLELKADPRIQDKNGATCAHYAVQLEHIHVLAVLMDVEPGRHWDVLTIKDSRGKSAVDYARRPERESCLHLLQTRMGGPCPVVWQVFKGWLADKTGMPRQQKAWEKLCMCSSVSFGQTVKA